MELYTIEGFKINSLEHHGVKGQKWGRRLYQNLDGSLTTLGRMHYGIKKRAAGDAAITKYRLNRFKKQISGEPTASSKQSKVIEKRLRKSAESKVEKSENEKYNKALTKYKEDILKKDSLKDVLNNKNLFSNEELNSIYTRKMSEKKVIELQKQEHGKAYDFIEKVSGFAGGLSKAYNSYDTINSVTKKIFGSSILPESYEQRKEEKKKEEEKKRARRLREMGEDEINSNIQNLTTEDLRELSIRAGYIDKITNRTNTPVNTTR